MRDRDISFDYVVQAGADLIEVKEELGHGQFDSWKLREFSTIRRSDRTITNYMKLTRIVNDAEESYGPTARERFRRHGASIWYDVTKENRAEIIQKVATGELAEKKALKALIKPKKLEDVLEKFVSLFWKTVNDGDSDPLDLAAVISSKLLTEAREQEGKSPAGGSPSVI